MNFIRSTIFNICFYGLTLAMCILYLPLLVLPRQWYIDAVHFWLHVVDFLEKAIIGINYEIRGGEHLPDCGPYIVAAKHQSAYETFKLHLLFDDPAIILKKELLHIPLWGLYLKKADVIAIDRSTPEKALRSIEDGAKRVAAQGRPIVIFPQGTRVKPHATAEKKPYKPGVARVQDATGLPIIPMAVNSGVFWPKNSYMKKPGKVIIEFLEPIPAGKYERKDLMHNLEAELEAHSTRLVQEAESIRKKKRPYLTLFFAFLFILSAAGYTKYWFYAAGLVRQEYNRTLTNLSLAPEKFGALKVTGFPGQIKARIDLAEIEIDKTNYKAQNASAKAWPVPGAPVFISIERITGQSENWYQDLNIKDVDATITYLADTLTIRDSALYIEDFKLSITGTIGLDQKPYPKLDLELAMTNPQSLFRTLVRMDVIDNGVGLYAGTTIAMMADEDGIARVPLIQKNRTLYAGPLPVASLPDLSQDPPPVVPDNPPAPVQ